MVKQRISGLFLGGLIISLVFCVPAISLAKDIDIGLPGDSIQILGSNLCLNSSCISSWPASGSWNTNGTSIYYNNGYVGIGISDPIAALDVYRTEPFRTRGQVVFGGSPYISGGNRLLMVDNSGNVIATTTSVVGLPASSVSGQTLRSNGTTWVASSNLFNNDTNVGIGTTGPLYKLDVRGAVSVERTDGLVFSLSGSSRGGIKLNSSNDMLFTTGGTVNALSILSGGNVGIGTTTPSQKLHVNGGAQLDAISFGVTPGQSQSLALTTVEFVNAKVDNLLPGGASSTWAMAGNNIYNVNSGNVGIGTTAPYNKLELKTSTSGDGQTIWLNTVTAGDYTGLFFKADNNQTPDTYKKGALVWERTGAYNEGRFHFLLDNTDNSTNVDLTDSKMTILSTGNVGIGTTNPQQKLQVDGNIVASSTYPQIYVQDTGTVLGGIRADRLTKLEIKTLTAAPLSFQVNSSEKMRIQNDGNVGIATTTPIQKLHVNGGAQLDAVSFGVTPGQSQTLALTTVEYVNAKVGGVGGIGAGTSGQTLRHDGTAWVANSNLFNDGTNVGIGTTNPTSKLQVSGGNIQLDNNQQYTIKDSTGVARRIALLNNSNILAFGDAGNVATYFYSGGNLVFAPNGDVRFPGDGVWKSGGNVGIGTTLPNAKLNVVGADNTSSNFSLNVNSNSGTSTFAVRNDGVVAINNKTQLNTDSTRLYIAGSPAPNTTAQETVLRLYRPWQSGISFAEVVDFSLGKYAAGQTGTQLDIKLANAGVGGAASSGAADVTVMSLLSNGNVGIATTTPIQKLHVNGGAQLDAVSFGVTPGQSQTLALTTVEYVNAKVGGVGGIGAGTSGQTLRHDGTAWVANSNLFNTGTNVGIGTTNPRQRIEVQIPDVAGTSGIRIGTVSDYYYDIGRDGISGYLKFYGSQVGANGYIFDGLSGEKMRITSGGNVGIGTTAPGAKLDVSGTTYLRGVALDSIFGYSGNNIAFTNAGNTTFVGNVGIGTTTPRGKLDVVYAGSNNMYFDSNGTLHISWASSERAAIAQNTSDAGWGLGLPNVGGIRLGGGTLFSYLIGNGTNLLLNPTAGNVGIATTTPIQKLHVNGGAQLDAVSFGVTPGQSQTLALTTVEYVNNKVDSLLPGGASSTWAMAGNNIYNVNSGNVGIGVTSPAAKLDVNGAVKTSRLGTYGTYSSTQVQGIWSISEGYPISTTNNNFGTQYGIGYAYNTTGGAPFSATHQIVFTNNGTINAAIGLDGRGYFKNNVGIGTTAPNAKLSFGTLVGSPAIYFFDGGTNIRHGIGVQNSELQSFVMSDSHFSWNKGGDLQPTGTNELMRLVANSGNVGIGTTSPSQKLHVNGGAQLDAISFGVTPGQSQALALTTVEFVNAKIDNLLPGGASSTWAMAGNNIYNVNSGNVGIATTNPTGALDISNGGTSLVIGADNASTVRTNGVDKVARIVMPSTQNNLNQMLFFGTGSFVAFGGGSSVTSPAGTLAFYTGTPNVAGAGVQRMTINSSGNVGIGTTNPTQLLNLSGATARARIDATANNGEAAFISYNDNGGWLTYSKFGSARTGTSAGINNAGLSLFASYGSDFVIETIDNKSLIFATADSEKMRITGAGNVGIGTTTPSQKLHVNGGAQLDAVSFGVTPGQSQTLALTTVEYVNNKVDNLLPGGASSTWAMAGNNIYNVNSGNVGIGTTNPGAKLEVAGGVLLPAAGSIQFGTTWNSGSLSFLNGPTTAVVINVPSGKIQNNLGKYLTASSNVGQFGTQDNFGLSLVTNSTERLRIDTSGNVGIGTASPSEAKLQVNSLNEAISWNDATLKLLYSGSETVDRGGSIAFGGSTYHAYGRISGRKESTTNSNAGYLRFDTRSDAGTLEKMRITSAGNVGIGTTAPGAKLDVSGTTYLRGVALDSIFGYSGNNIAFTNAGNTTFVGNVGIATTTPIQKLHVNGGAQLDAVSFGVTPGQSQTLALTTVEYVNNKVDSLLPGGASSTWAMAGNNIYNVNSGNVGIGTTAPNQKLEVKGVISTNQVNVFSNPLVSATANGDRYQMFYPGSYKAAMGLNSDGRVWFQGYNSLNGGFGFWTGSNDSNLSEKLTIRGDGNVGIGTTNPAAKLELYQSGGDRAMLQIDEPGFLNYGMIFRYNSDDGILKLNRLVNGTENTSSPLMSWGRASSNVGIGIISPRTKFDIVASSPKLRLANDVQNAGEVGIEFSHSTYAGSNEVKSAILTKPNGGYGRGDMYFVLDSAGDSNGYVSDAVDTKMIIKNLGNVGIGTTAPSQKLHVNGSAQLDAISFGVTPGSTQNLALATVEYVNGRVGSIIGAGTSGQTLRYDGTAWVANSNLFNNGTNVGIGTTDPGGYKLKVAGDVSITGVLRTQTGSDFAEEFAVEKDIEAGTVVVMGNLGYKSAKPSVAAYDTKVIGIVSDAPSIVAGRVESKNKVVVAMAGVVTVKVTSSNGRIEKGDLLTTSDIEGYAMKADKTKPGTIIGKALENLNSRRGEIKVLVNLQ